MGDGKAMRLLGRRLRGVPRLPRPGRYRPTATAGAITLAVTLRIVRR